MIRNLIEKLREFFFNRKKKSSAYREGYFLAGISGDMLKNIKEQTKALNDRDKEIYKSGYFAGVVLATNKGVGEKQW